ncbi:MAG: hypothetical protein A4E20_08935 [Nitrospira sp. SG-bin2]|uniref:hypothetical protein n=1 Tax=Nitrospira cf. moscoviensis SBR1015 TaxID=96242 RepID=UPI000A0A2505|nr:hypothetical protein [Nitrospira cf. moscoviensis SBR1015]OQW35856.1 MAG: hypothetical protein A4E20_08935 [Nitrospira sp. SG-bin2]
MFPMQLNWRKAPPQEELACEVGDRFLVAVRCCDPRNHSRQWWDFSVITAEENGGFELDGSSWGYDWSDVEWYVSVKELSGLPYAEESQAEATTSLAWIEGEDVYNNTEWLAQSCLHDQGCHFVYRAVPILRENAIKWSVNDSDSELTDGFEETEFATLAAAKRACEELEREIVQDAK